MEKSGIAQTMSNSIEDFSEYADAEESVSAPTELLAEFLHSVMVKDYEKALGYCTQILSYEPDYDTVKEFRPLIEEKLEMLRNEESEDGSSDSSLSCTGSTSDSSENLRSLTNETNWETGSLNCSSSEIEDENKEMSGKWRATQSDIANGNLATNCSSLTIQNSIKSNSSKEINASATRTIINSKLLAHQTRTRILRRGSAEDNKNNDFNNSKGENPATALHSTNTRVLKKGNSRSPVKDNKSKTFAWFSSLQENFFGSKKRENLDSRKVIQNPKSTDSSAKGKTDSLKIGKKDTKQTSS